MTWTGYDGDQLKRLAGAAMRIADALETIAERTPRTTIEVDADEFVSFCNPIPGQIPLDEPVGAPTPTPES